MTLFSQFTLAQAFELAVCSKHGHFSCFGNDVDSVSNADWRRPKRAAQSLSPNDFSCFGFNALRDAFIGNQKEHVIMDDWRRDVIRISVDFVGQFGVGTRLDCDDKITTAA